LVAQQRFQIPYGRPAQRQVLWDSVDLCRVGFVHGAFQEVSELPMVL